MEKQEKKSSDEKEKSEWNTIMSNSFDEEIDTKSLKDLKKYEGILKSWDNKFRSRIKSYLLLVPVIVMALILIVIFLSYFFDGETDFKLLLFRADNAFVICLGIFIELFIFIFRIYFLELFDNKKQLITRQIRIIQRQNSTSNEKKEKDFFDRIIDINNDNLSDYYQQVRKNVNNLLYVGIFVGLAGFLFILISLIIGAISGKNINLVYLSTVTGIIIDSFAGTFFIQYGKSIKNMQFYFEGLLKTQDKIIEMKGKDNKQKEPIEDIE